jgi:Uma2 family endonuclease
VQARKPLGHPDGAVETRSPDDAVAALIEECSEYLTRGSRYVWLIDPNDRF